MILATVCQINILEYFMSSIQPNIKFTTKMEQNNSISCLDRLNNSHTFAVSLLIQIPAFSTFQYKRFNDKLRLITD